MTPVRHQKSCIRIVQRNGTNCRFVRLTYFADYRQRGEIVVSDTALQDPVIAQLERMLSRPPLVSSPSLSRLLRYLVEETLAGRAAEINEYTLGVRIFHRNPDFNPRVDPIVRVQTHYLRAKLAQYYAGAGAQDPVLIELPARTYVPRYPQPELPAVAELLEPPALPPAEASAVDSPHTSRRTAVVGMSVVALAAFGLLGYSWHAVSAHHDPDPMEQDLYARGRYLLDRQSEAALLQSVDCFRQATTHDPRFAAAYAGLADALDNLVQYGYMPPREGMEEARLAAQRALSLDPHLAEGYVALAAISEAYDWDFKKAETEYRRALQLNPELPAAHLWYGMFLRDQGRIKEAMPELRRAEEMEPMSVMASINLAYALHIAGDTTAAVEMAQRAQELNPELPIAEVLLANIYRSHSEIGDVESTLARARDLSEGNAHALSALACLYARLGRREESASVLLEMEQLAKERYVSPFDLGNVALSLGDEDRAVNWLEQAYRERSTGMVFLCKEKSDSIMKSPRLRSLVQKIGRG
jgi:tetratricopeptide (TPR) repeat protein